MVFLCFMCQLFAKYIQFTEKILRQLKENINEVYD